jgi:LPS export ABC transporter protein LptC
MNKPSAFRALLLLVAVSLIIVILGIALREKKRPFIVTPENTPAADTGAQLEMNNVSYSTLGSDNTKLWDLNARTARIFDDGNSLSLDGLEMVFYQRNAQPYRLKAEQGTLDMETRDIHISGNVKAELPDGVFIETHSAFYDHTSRTITSRDPLTITRGQLVMRGVGMTADLSAETVTITHNVKVTGN